MNRFAALALCVVCAFGVMAIGAEPPADPSLVSEAKVRHALNEPTNMDFTETPLSDVVHYLADLHFIKIQLDTRALEDAGVGSDTPVTRTLKDVALKSALNLMLRDLDLTTHITDGVLLITTRDALDKVIETRAYNVEDAIAPGTEAKEVAAVLQGLLQSGHPLMGGMGGMGGGMGGGMFAVEDSEGKTQACQACCKATSAVAAAEPRMRIVPFRNLVVVRASLADHADVAAVLAELKAKLK